MRHCDSVSAARGYLESNKGRWVATFKNVRLAMHDVRAATETIVLSNRLTCTASIRFIQGNRGMRLCLGKLHAVGAAKSGYAKVQRCPDEQKYGHPLSHAHIHSRICLTLPYVERRIIQDARTDSPWDSQRQSYRRNPLGLPGLVLPFGGCPWETIRTALSLPSTASAHMTTWSPCLS
jgi:hypothetical protein